MRRPTSHAQERWSGDKLLAGRLDILFNTGTRSFGFRDLRVQDLKLLFCRHNACLRRADGCCCLLIKGERALRVLLCAGTRCGEDPIAFGILVGEFGPRSFGIEIGNGLLNRRLL